MLLIELIKPWKKKTKFWNQELKLSGFEDEIWKKLKLCSVFVQNREKKREKNERKSERSGDGAAGREEENRREKKTRKIWRERKRSFD